MSTTLKMANGDLYIHPSTGKPATISGPAKVSQDIAEILLTPSSPSTVTLSSQAFKRNYGNDIISLNSPPQFAGLLGESLVSKKIEEAITRLQSLQQADPSLTESEKIQNINRLLVSQSNVTDFIFYLEIFLAGGTVIELQRLSATRLDHQVRTYSLSDDRPISKIR